MLEAPQTDGPVSGHCQLHRGGSLSAALVPIRFASELAILCLRLFVVCGTDAQFGGRVCLQHVADPHSGKENTADRQLAPEQLGLPSCQCFSVQFRPPLSVAV